MRSIPFRGFVQLQFFFSKSTKNLPAAINKFYNTVWLKNRVLQAFTKVITYDSFRTQGDCSIWLNNRFNPGYYIFGLLVRLWSGRALSIWSGRALSLRAKVIAIDNFRSGFKTLSFIQVVLFYIRCWQTYKPLHGRLRSAYRNSHKILKIGKFILCIVQVRVKWVQ